MNSLDMYGAPGRSLVYRILEYHRWAHMALPEPRLQ